MILYLENKLFEMTKSSTDFDCMPRGTQIENFIKFIIKSGNNNFTVEDIRELFIKANMKSPRTSKVIKPTRSQIKNQIERIIAKEMTFIRKEADEVYNVMNNI